MLRCSLAVKSACPPLRLPVIARLGFDERQLDTLGRNHDGACQLCRPARQLLAERAEQIQGQASDPTLSLIVFLASEGIRFLEVMKLLSLDGKTLEQVGLRLEKLASEANP